MKHDLKHEYLQSCASRSLSHLSVKSLRFFCMLTFIEMLVLVSWIPASEKFLNLKADYFGTTA